MVRGAQTACLLVALTSIACEGPQSTLNPAGKGAEQVAELFWWMVAGAVVIWIAVVGTAVYAIAVNPAAHDERKSELLIIGGGVVFPTIALTVLLLYGLSLLPTLLEPAPEGSLRIDVSGEQWWWRVRYLPPDGPEFELANEIHLPVGEPVIFHLSSPDVVHSFWIPSLGGKVDMIPGRTTRLTLEPTRTGRFRGACAEYCGASHALMNFTVIVEGRDEFETWMNRQRLSAMLPAGTRATRGLEVFRNAGCGACHTIRGTTADGRVGPDLTHVGSRATIGAGILPAGDRQFLRWIADTESIKPGVHMPPFGMLERDELEALSAYLGGLQ